MLRVAFSLLWLGVAWLAQLVVIANIVGLFLVLVYLLWFKAYYLVSLISVEVFITSYPVLMLFLFHLFLLRSSLPHTLYWCFNVFFLHLVSFAIILSSLLSSVWPHASNFGTITSTCVWWAVADYEPKLRVRHHPKRLGMSRSPRNCEDSVVGLQTFTNELQFVDGTCAQGPFSKHKPPATRIHMYE